MKDEMALLSIYDFLGSLISNAPDSQLIQIFCHVLVNNLDGCVFRYLLHLLEVADSINWKDPSEITCYIETVYPFVTVGNLLF